MGTTNERMALFVYSWPIRGWLAVRKGAYVRIIVNPQYLPGRNNRPVPRFVTLIQRRTSGGSWSMAAYRSRSQNLFLALTPDGDNLWVVTVDGMAQQAVTR